MALRYRSRSGGHGKRAKLSRTDAVAAQNFADLKNFGSDPSRAHDASLSLEIGSPRQACKIFKGRRSQAGRLAGLQAGWLAGRLAGWLPGRLAGWQAGVAGWLAGWLAARQADRLAGWQAGRLAGRLAG